MSTTFTKAALENIEETAANWHADLERLRSGRVTGPQLLEVCLNGAHEDRVQGWHDYVDALVADAEEIDAAEAAARDLP